jgi:hypothetical protein
MPFLISKRPEFKAGFSIVKPASGANSAAARRGGFSPVARRNHPFNKPAYGSKLASYVSRQPRKADAHEAIDRLCLCAVPIDGLGAWQDRLNNWLRRATGE